LQRQRVKRLLSDVERDHPGVRASIFAAMGNVMAEHLLDARLHPRQAQVGADPWIDDDDCGDRELPLASLPQRVSRFEQSS
jgi:tRNA 2-thiocytidine biosynthesis protein TtcA